MTPDYSHAFAIDYGQARAKFVSAAQQVGLTAQAYPHPLPGRQGEALALDAVRDGPADASRWLVVSSACHGVEGYCGSGVQVCALADAPLRQQAREAGVSLLYLHALNPYGFSHLRRVTHENVDLNRNFCDFEEPLPFNRGYDELHALLLPETWPPTPANQAALADYVARHGRAQLQSALSQGQYHLPDGMFFGGQAPTWSRQALLQALRDHLPQGVRHIAWVDLHTGLGPCGVGERICIGPTDAHTLARARHWWSGGGATPVTSTTDGSSVSPTLNGLMGEGVARAYPQAVFTGITMEYGTLPFDEVMHALRADHWLVRHPQAPAGQREAIGQQLKAAFYVDTPAWKNQVVPQALQALSQAVQGLRSS